MKPIAVTRPLSAAFALALFVFASPALHAKSQESSIKDEIAGLESTPAEQRPAATVKVAGEIQALPAGASKVQLADDLFRSATEGDQGKAALQAVGDALSQALSQHPLPAKKGQPQIPYMDLAKLVRYAGVTTTLNDPLSTQAAQILASDDADVAKADFTLKDLHGNKVTLSALRGKIVLVNFWSTTSPASHQEMPYLDVIYTHYEPQGLVILSITSDNEFTVGSFLAQYSYHPTVLFDSAGKVTKEFHVDRVPRTFVYNRDGKLVAQSIGMCTQMQFFAMLAKGGLHPQRF